MSRTVSQRRAEFALEFVNSYLANARPTDVDKMSTHINKTPIRILQNGLGQALAFLLADAEGKATPAQRLYDEMQKWLCGQRDRDLFPCRVYSDGPTSHLMRQLVEGDRAKYLAAQEEALRLFTWLKKFADAYLSVPAVSQSRGAR
ncbi:MAG: type III-B CRISPR module-associated protein Cmr5 [Candidatus Rokubacteria bacterium]|nr:type III-B CRISPR module-associated protein Cmr5 [Candidatus Rokubacteria bacterium]